MNYSFLQHTFCKYLSDACFPKENNKTNVNNINFKGRELFIPWNYAQQGDRLPIN